jgi:general secretion pathway protein K
MKTTGAIMGMVRAWLRDERGASTRKSRADKRGVALLLVLSSIALMTITVVDFQEEQIADLQAAFAERDSLVAEYTARSGINLARLFVASEPTMRQGLLILKFMFGGKAVPQLPIWEFSDAVLGAFSDKSGQEGFGALGNFDLTNAKNLGGTEGSSFQVTVVDEDSKINLNLGARGNIIAENRFGTAFLGLTMAPAYDLLFERNDRDGNTSPRQVICGAIMDWSDPDEIGYACDPRNFQGGGASGGEDLSYQLLPHPYRAKNAPFDSLEEVRLVRGVGDDFWATFIDPDPSNPKKRVMTVWGQGPINVNTSSPQAVFGVVCGLAPDAQICIDPNMGAQFLTMFGVLRSFTAGIPLFGSPADFVTTIQGGGAYGKLLFSTLNIPPVRFQSPADAAKNFTTESKVFSIYATGEMKGYKRTTRIRIHAVVDFRGSPAIPNSLGPTGMPVQPGQNGQPGQPGQPSPVPGMATQTGGVLSGPPGMPPGTSADAINGALIASPAGTIVYYRVE